jgi:hypothetical protein
MITAALLLAASACAAGASAYGPDPRVELLGVLQHLSGRRPDLPADPAYLKAVEKAFGARRDHAAVKLYRDLDSAPGGEGLGVALLYCTDPPELALRPLGTPPPYFGGDDAAGLSKALVVLRAFAKDARFAAFYRAHAKDYERAASASREALGVEDPLAKVEAYARLSLDSKARWLVSPLYVPPMRGSFIVPYPDPSILRDPGERPFEVYTTLAWAPGAKSMGPRVTQLHRAALWQEPLFVFVDPALAAFDASLGVPPEKFYGPVAACRRQAADCVKSWLVGALARRLDTAAFGAPSMQFDGSDPLREKWVLRLEERLKEYEADPKKPTLWEFLPRLLSVFPEDAGLKISAPPARAGVTRVKQLFPGPAKR